MFLKYYFKEPKYKGAIIFTPIKGFKHIIELTDFSDELCDCKEENGGDGDCSGACYINANMQEEIFKIYTKIGELFGFNYNGVEPVFSEDEYIVRLYFEKEEDAVLFKLSWDEKTGGER